MIGKAGLCYKCLDKNNIARDCTRAVECDVYHKRHHTAMHISKNEKPNGKHRDARRGMNVHNKRKLISPGLKETD